jgi:YYY domain-containing protein
MIEAQSTTAKAVKVNSWGITRSDVLVGVLLVVMMLAGGYFRFVGQNWDDYVRWHPDERFLTDLASLITGPLNSTESGDPILQQDHRSTCLERYPSTGGIGGYFDTYCSTMNPHNVGKGFYAYGTVPLFIVRGAAELVTQVTGDSIWVTYNGIHLVWRAVSALAEMAVILVVFFTGVKMHDKWIGLLAATLYAATVFSIQQAHFGTADAISNLFVMLTIYFAVRVQFDGQLWDYVFAGLAFGAALGSRINIAPVFGVVMLATIIQVLPALTADLAARERGRLLWTHLGGLLLSLGVAFVTFRLVHPYSFMGPGIFGLALNPRWLADMSEAQYQVSGAMEIPPNWQWVGRTPYLFAWNNMVVWGMGLLLGLSGWIAWGVSGWRFLRGRPGALRNIILFAWVLVYFGWLGRNWVASMRYFLPLYGPLVLLAAWGLVAFVRSTQGKLLLRGLAWVTLVAVTAFTLLWALMFTNIYRNLFAPAQASYWIFEQVPADFSMRVEGAPEGTPLINIAIANGWRPENDPVLNMSTYYQGQSVVQAFTAPADGQISTIHAPHLGRLEETVGDEVALAFEVRSSGDNLLLAEGTLRGDFARDEHVMGNAYDVVLNRPVEVKAGESYVFNMLVVEGGPIISSGASFTWEGSWDEGTPPKVCTFPEGITLSDSPPPGMFTAYDCNGRSPWDAHINGYKLEIVQEDIPDKRDLMQRALDNSDYLIISTNRRYDTNTRIPMRWPMTTAYYDALFSGELGFELAEVFQETFEFGPFRVSDQHLPFYDSPPWLNEFEAEEAFHVYDHPAVMIFRKTEAYSSENTRAILDVPLNRIGAFSEASTYSESCSEVFLQPGGHGCDLALPGVATLSSVQAAQFPTQLNLTNDRREIQYENGTWSELYDRESPINAQPVLTVVAWWLAIMGIGWVVFPAVFTILPGLADRGYSIAKIIGLLVLAWTAWAASTAFIPLWSQGGLWLILGLFVLINLWIAISKRREFFGYVRDHWRRLLGIELITVLAFLAFLGVRLTNPDLWHSYFGGEKPMDFAYFNAVLRSTVFPAIDPWFAGGYLNYYYFGFVLVGSPVLLLGVVPSVAYNLIIPTLFALTGIGAFSVAFNAVSHFKARDPEALPDEAEQRPLRRVGNPWVAGIAALVLAVVLGNLDTPRVLGNALAEMGGYERPMSIQDHLTKQYQLEHGMPPDAVASMDIAARSRDISLSDRLDYEISHSISLVTSVFNGIGRALQGQPLPIAAHHWYWRPTRLIMDSEAPGLQGGAINEMPFFTFLYGDLHAHMMAMPVLLLIMAFLLNEILIAGQERRRRLSQFFALALGAMAVGLLQALNTWDWPSFMILAVLGLSYAWWISWPRWGRRALVNYGLRIGGFLALSFAFVLPYSSWFASAYGSISLWEGSKTHLWAYLDVHGVFLFLLTSLLVWETARWWRGVYVRSLRGRFIALAFGVVGVIAVLGISVVLAAIEYQATLIALPLLVWVAVLFLRKGQTREMQFLLALAGLALGLTLGVEYVVIDGDVGRQNTVFKFYIQAWLLFSVVGGAAFAWMWATSDHWARPVRYVWYGVAGILFLVAAAYPIMAVQGRRMDRFDPALPLTLDGMDYMQSATYGENGVWMSLEDDYHMLRWLQENIQGTPVVMETQSSREYYWGGRVSIYTGMPSVLGWRHHQSQQRTLEPLGAVLSQRRSNINAFYGTTDLDAAWRILDHYGVGYVIVGELERAYHPEAGLAKFEQMVSIGLLDKVYDVNNTAVYQVIPQERTVQGAAGQGEG